MITSRNAKAFGQEEAQKLFNHRSINNYVRVDQVELAAMLSLAYDEGSKAATTTAKVPSSDLATAREAYFGLGGLESDIGPRDDASWYWRRAFKLARNRMEAAEAKLTK